MDNFEEMLKMVPVPRQEDPCEIDYASLAETFVDTLRFNKEDIRNSSEKLHDSLRRIGLALNISHNVIATDDPDLKVDEKSWEIDHSQEILDLKYIKNILINIGICCECTCCNKNPKEDTDEQWEKNAIEMMDSENRQTEEAIEILKEQIESFENFEQTDEDYKAMIKDAQKFE